MKNILLTLILLILPVTAHADWSGAGMHPMGTPNLMPNQPSQHETHTPPQRIEPQHPAAPQPIENYTPKQAQYVRHNPPVRNGQPVKSQQVAQRHEALPGYFRRDISYYQDIAVPVLYSDVDTSSFVVPDGFDTVMVNGETFYYDQGIFYQEVDDQLTAIPAVLGAVVDNIPEDYQIVMADGAHYLVTGGVYYQRVDQGFQVVQPPASDLE